MIVPNIQRNKKCFSGTESLNVVLYSPNHVLLCFRATAGAQAQRHSVLNHFTVNVRDFSKRAPDS